MLEVSANKRLASVLQQAGQRYSKLKEPQAQAA
jgi:hypothetical protein